MPSAQDSRFWPFIHSRSIGFSCEQDQPVSAASGDCALFARMLRLAEGRSRSSRQTHGLGLGLGRYDLEYADDMLLLSLTVHNCIEEEARSYGMPCIRDQDRVLKTDSRGE